MIGEPAGQLRTLVLTCKSVFPAIGGAPMRNWQTINIMLRLGPVATFSVLSRRLDGFDPPPGVALHRSHWSGRSFLLRVLKRALWWVRPLGHDRADIFYDTAGERDLKSFLVEFKPDLVILEELWLHRYLSLIRATGCRVIYDSHNVEYQLRREIAASAHTIWKRFAANVLLSKVKAIEGLVVRSVDQVWVCSHAEVQLLQDLYVRTAPINVIPNGIDVDHYAIQHLPGWPNAALSASRGTLIFTATFAYPPNALAAEFLIDEIYPLVKRELPGCRLLMVGSGPTPHMLAAAARDPGIEVTGRVPDVRPYLAIADVVVVPLSQGSGTRLKILEAFSARRPVVSTTKGAEGLEFEEGKHLLIRDTAADIAAGVVQLLNDQELSRTLASNAYVLVESRYGWNAVEPSVSNALKRLSVAPLLAV